MSNASTRRYAAQPGEMNIVRDYKKRVPPEEKARIRAAWQAEIEKLQTDEEIREWFRCTWLVVGKLVGDHREGLRKKKRGTPDVGDTTRCQRVSLWRAGKTKIRQTKSA